MGSRGPAEPAATESARRDGPPRERRAAQAPSADVSPELALLRLQQGVGNAATTWLVTRGRSSRTVPRLQRRSVTAGDAAVPDPPRAVPSAMVTSSAPTAQAPLSPEPEPDPPVRPATAPPSPVPDQQADDGVTTTPPNTAVSPVASVAVDRGDGPTAEDGVRRLAAATDDLDTALADHAPATTPAAPQTRAGAVIVEGITAAALTGRASITDSARAVLAELQAGDRRLAAQLSSTGGAAVAGMAAADGQAATSVDGSVSDTRTQITEGAADHAIRIRGSSVDAVAAADSVVTQHAEAAEAVGKDQAEQAAAAGRDAEAREHAVVESAADQAEATPAQGEPRDRPPAVGQPTPTRSDYPARDRGTTQGSQSSGPAAEPAGGIRAGTATAASALRGGGAKIAAGVARQAGPLTSALARTASGATSAVRHVQAQANRQVAKGAATTRRHLAAATRTATSALGVRADGIRGAGAAAVAGVVAGLAAMVRRALGASVEEERAATSRYGRLRVPSATAEQTTTAAAGQIARRHSGMVADIRQGGREASGPLQEAGSTATGELTAAGAQAQAAVADGAARSATAVRGLAGPADAAFGAVTAKAAAMAGQAVDHADRHLADVVRTADAGLQGATVDVRAGLGEHEAQVSNRAAMLLAQTSTVGPERPAGHGPTSAASVQRNTPQPTGSWLGQQLGDLKDMVSDPGFWAGTAVAVGLFFVLPVALPAAAIAGIALVVGGIVGGIVSALSGGGSILKGALIGGLVGLGFFFGGLALSALGLTGLSLLLGVMALGALIGIVVNLATGERLDRGLLGNLLFAALLHKFSRWVQSRRAGGSSDRTGNPPEPEPKPDDPGGRQKRPPENEQEQQERGRQKPPPLVSALKQAVVQRAEVFADHIGRLRRRLGNTTAGRNATLPTQLERDALAARDLLNRADRATTDAELNQLNRRLDTLKAENRAREVQVLRAEATDWVDAAARRITALRDRIPPGKLKPPEPSKPGANRADPAKLRQGMAEAERALRDLRRDQQKAAGQTSLETLKKNAEKLLTRLKELEVANEALLRPPTLASEGVSADAAEAFRTVDAKEIDPLGDRHKAGAADRHFDAARREAAGQIVATKGKATGGKPFSHVRDIQNARNAVFAARQTMINELEHPRPDLTPYGRSKLQEQLNKASQAISEVDQFLAEIGWPSDRPFAWVKERRAWVPAADVPEMRAMAAGELNRLATELAGNDTTGTIREIRLMDNALATTLETRRTTLLADAAREQAAVNAVQTEAQVATLRQAVEQLQNLWRQLHDDIHLSRVR